MDIKDIIYDIELHPFIAIGAVVGIGALIFISTRQRMSSLQPASPLDASQNQVPITETYNYYPASPVTTSQPIIQKKPNTPVDRPVHTGGNIRTSPPIPNGSDVQEGSIVGGNRYWWIYPPGSGPNRTSANKKRLLLELHPSIRVWRGTRGRWWYNPGGKQRLLTDK